VQQSFSIVLAYFRYLDIFQYVRMSLISKFLFLVRPPIANFRLETVSNNWVLIVLNYEAIIFDRTRLLLEMHVPCMRMRSKTGVRLPGPSHCECRFRNCLNQFGFNCAPLCNNNFRSNLSRFRDLLTFFNNQSSSTQPSLHQKFRSRNGLNRLSFNFAQLFRDRFKLVILLNYVKYYEYTDGLALLRNCNSETVFRNR